MASAPSVTNTVKTVNNKTGITTSTSTVKSGNSVTTTKTTTIGASKTVSKPSTATTKAAGCPVATASRWIIGPNDDGWTMCGPVAVANALLASTGVEATNADIEQLYKAAGGAGDSGAPFASILRAAADPGLAGERLARYESARWEHWALTCPIRADLVLLAIHGMADLHTAAIVNDGLDAVMWGAAVPLRALNATVIEAWSLTWHGQEAQ